MTRHHRRGAKPVGHPRGELIDAIAPRRIPHQVDAVRIDVLEDDHILDQPIEEIVDVSLMPKIPSIGGRPRRHINTFLRNVKLLLVIPLLGVHSSGCSAATVHRDKKGSPRRWRIPVYLVPKRHLQSVDLQNPGIHIHLAVAANISLVTTDEVLRRLSCLVFTQGRVRDIKFRHAVKSVPLEGSPQLLDGVATSVRSIR